MKIQKLKEFHNELLEQYKQRLSGDTHLVMKMADHWEFLATTIAQCPKLHKKIKKIKTLNKYQELVDHLLH